MLVVSITWLRLKVRTCTSSHCSGHLGLLHTQLIGHNPEETSRGRHRQFCWHTASSSSELPPLVNDNDNEVTSVPTRLNRRLNHRPSKVMQYWPEKTSTSNTWQNTCLIFSTFTLPAST